MNESNDAVQVNTKVLDQLYRAIRDNKITAKIGILGAKNARTGPSSSNASVGAAHEYGSPARRLPIRSFLRMPITEKLPKELEKSGFFNEDMLKANIKDGNLKQYVDKIAIAAVAVVLQAFDTTGFGTWKLSNMDYKTVKQTLIETGQLRDSIDYEVK